MLRRAEEMTPRHRPVRIAQFRPGHCWWTALAARALATLAAAAWFQPGATAQQRSIGTIVYTHAPDGSDPWPVTDIYSITGKSLVKALTNDGHSHNPTWSPDGRRILFIHDSTLQTAPAYREEKQFESHHPVELHVMDADGGNRHLLRRLEPVIYSAAWSPDGRTLAVTSLPETRVDRPTKADEPMRAGLFLLPATGQDEPRLLFRNAFTPSWSPDGRRLAFSVEKPRGQWSVHTGKVDGSGDIQLTDPRRNEGSPAWSPDGKRIAFDEFAAEGRQQILVMDEDGTHVRQLTRNPNWSCGHPSWSPDGKQIVFSCRSTAGSCGMGVSSTGQILPPCVRRLFIASLRDAASEPTRINDHDSASPAFAPAP